ncbi:putative ATP-dependent RNA helicase TDRD12 isoform X2 [Coregonus clupeaformis]|uniref:putative ATP-dependent RNA helicase TDRD12 isoform X2 n=1 Tax=Coregonus clupeaformis TaxID=59861 RepID=UPI001BE025B0|nr:putative ATP-dependent RNA helicase TDRD12 isoform X2 [Coregonus clupeaformis]XP_041693841.1 putative ATP-dependent RNA helicase TDRD12 isoform X2 [Coregonus clupeaformis]
MLEINMLKVENPSCLWGRFVNGPGIEAVENKKAYDDLQVKMNLFYHEVNLDVQKIKPSTIEAGQVCVVYWSALRSWCRAIVESLFLGTVGTQVMCFLVDHGERIIVSSDEIRALLEKFLHLPFWVRKFQLAGVHPMTLQVSGDCLEKAELIPSTQWDSSATRYLHNLLQASTEMEAVLCETQADCTAIELYLTVKNVKICVNDDLVSKKFAYFTSQKAHQTSGKNGVVDRSPAVLACDIFSETQNFLATDGCTVRSLSDFPPRQQDPTVHNQVVDPWHLTTSGKEASKASNEVSNPKKSLENGRNPPEGGNKKAAQRQNKKSNTFSEIDGDKDESDDEPGEDTDTSLVSELFRNLNLLRFMKFVNSASSTQRAAIPNTELNEEKEEGGVQRFSAVTEKAEEEPITAVQQIGQQTETAVCGESQPVDPVEQCTEPSTPSDLVDRTQEFVFTEQQTTEEELVCARLLQLLNPDPLNPDVDSSEVTIVHTDLSRSGIVVHSAFTLDPCTSLANAPITDTFRRILMRKKYAGPSVAESYCWPAVARGCDTVLISHSGDQPLTYIPPFLAHMQLSSVFSALSSRTGPIAVILCPGWEKAQTVIDLLEESQTAQVLNPMVILVGLGKDEAKTVKIHNNCQVVVTTPFSLVRLLCLHCFQFLRLCHLVLDEVDLLFSRAPDEMTTILQHFQRVTASEERVSCPRQIIAVGKRWCHHLEGLLHNHMSNPTIIVTVMEEAALYGNVHQIILLCLDCTKISVLLGALDFTPDMAQKTLVITNSVEEVEHVFKAVSNTSAFSLKAHEGLTYQFDLVTEQWTKPIGPGTHVILVTTNECMKSLGIRDATCVVHYGFPSSPKLFGSRLFCMSQNFQNLSDKERAAENTAHPAKSVLLLSERNARHVIGVLRYLKRTEASLPPELLHFAQGVLQAKEEQKSDRPLCSYLKSFGFCRDSNVCSYRHSISPIQDQPLQPDSGTIVVLPLYIKTASVYYGRIVSKKVDSYESLAAEMTAYYATEKLGAKEVLEGGLYGVQEDEVYHRVRLTSVPDKGECLFCSVRALFLDEGREQEVKSHQLLQLPPQFHTLPPQALEIIVCRAMPIDAEVEWNPKVTRAISQKIKGLQHQAKVVLCLGNTVFVDPMVRMTRLPGLKTFINEYNIHAEILSTGMGTSNPQHLDLLKELHHGAGPGASAGETPLTTGPEGSEVTLENKVQAAEEALVHRMRAAVERLHCGQEVSVDPPQNQTAVLHAQTDLSQCHMKDSADLRQMDQKVFVYPTQLSPKPQKESPLAAVPDPSVAQLPTLMDRAQLPSPLPTPREAQLPSPLPTPREAQLPSPLPTPREAQLPSPLPTPREAQLPAPTPMDNDPKMEQWRSRIANLQGTTPTRRHTALQGFSPKDWISAVPRPIENGHLIDEKQINGQQVINSEKVISVDKVDVDAPKRYLSFHPQIKWFQRDDTVTLNIKLREPVEQRCEFFPDRVVYSAYVNDRPYRADLELHGNITAERCSWEMKCNEPVIRLVKQERGDWKMLLKQKSAFVSLDFDRFEEDEKKTLNGLCFVGHTGEEGCYVSSDSSSD